MRYWFIADTHFGHANIIRYCKRPFKDVDEMNEKLIQNWNEKIEPEDVVYHLGDFSFRGHDRYRKRLNGTIILLKGNHDDDRQTTITEMNIKHGGVNWYLTHVPPETNRPQFCLCGHIHEKWKSKRIGNKYLINVGVDVWGFKPITIQEILTELNKLKVRK